MDKKELEKHEIALLVEYDLYETINALEESGNNNKEEREMIIEEFIKECEDRNTTMTKAELKEHIISVLNRTIENMNKLKKRRSKIESFNKLSFL